MWQLSAVQHVQSEWQSFLTWHGLAMLQDKREKQDKLAESNLYIKNLDDTQTDDKLRQLFEVSHLNLSSFPIFC